MSKKLLLVDYENVPKIDLSLLDESYSAIIFVGAKQNPPKASVRASTVHRFQRVDFQKIEGTGKNALDFHIAFHLGRTVENEPETEFIVLSGDRGFDPLIAYINKAGYICSRAARFEDLMVRAQASLPASTAAVVCPRCHRSSTIPHYGGAWCTNCGCFASPPDQEQLPSNKIAQPTRSHLRIGAPQLGTHVAREAGLACGWCSFHGDMSGGIYDDGEWMCAGCVARFTNKQL